MTVTIAVIIASAPMFSLMVNASILFEVLPFGARHLRTELFKSSKKNISARGFGRRRALSILSISLHTCQMPHSNYPLRGHSKDPLYKAPAHVTAQLNCMAFTEPWLHRIEQD